MHIYLLDLGVQEKQVLLCTKLHIFYTPRETKLTILTIAGTFFAGIAAKATAKREAMEAKKIAMEKEVQIQNRALHLAFQTDDFDTAYQLHKEMDCICYENPEMGIYFIKDPDGYWLEVVPSRK